MSKDYKTWDLKDMMIPKDYEMMEVKRKFTNYVRRQESRLFTLRMEYIRRPKQEILNEMNDIKIKTLKYINRTKKKIEEIEERIIDI